MQNIEFIKENFDYHYYEGPTLDGCVVRLTFEICGPWTECFFDGFGETQDEAIADLDKNLEEKVTFLRQANKGL